MALAFQSNLGIGSAIWLILFGLAWVRRRNCSSVGLYGAVASGRDRPLDVPMRTVQIIALLSVLLPLNLCVGAGPDSFYPPISRIPQKKFASGSMSALRIRAYEFEQGVISRESKALATLRDHGDELNGLTTQRSRQACKLDA